MGRVQIHEELTFQSPTLVEGFLGMGLVGQIAAEHVVEELDMTFFGSVHCPGLPQVTAYEEGDTRAYPAVRLYGDEKTDLVALRTEVPVSPSEVADFAACVTEWLADRNGTALYVSGFPAERDDDERDLYGIATGDADRLLAANDIDPPPADGVWSGPTGALLARAGEVGLDAVGLVVESDPEFPDPEAACAYINRGVNPIAGVDVDDADLRDHAEEIRAEREQLAHQMNEPGDEGSRAAPAGMYQ